ncbi:MAG: thioredoxin [Pseudomonadota bacterium]
MFEANTDSNWVFDVTARDFDARVAKADVPVVVDFWAEWCGPCKQIAPILDSLASQYAGRLHVAKVNVDEETTLATGFGVRSIPYLVVFKDGKVVEELVGVQPEAELKQILDKHVEKAPMGLRVSVQDALMSGDYDTALAALEQARAAEPENPGIVADIARTLFAMGRAADADAALADLPDELAAAPEIEQLKAEIALARAADGLRDKDTLESLLAQSPGDAALTHELAQVSAATRDYDTALEQFFGLMRDHGDFGEDAGRRGLIGLFDVLGANDGRVRDYRRRMANLLN